MNPYKKNLEHMKLFIDFIENQKRYSRHTVRAYKVDLNQLVDHLGEELTIVELNKHDLHEYISTISKSISSKSLSRKIATIKSLFKYLVDENIAKINISKSLKIPKINKDLNNRNRAIKTPPNRAPIIVEASPIPLLMAPTSPTEKLTPRIRNVVVKLPANASPIL